MNTFIESNKGKHFTLSDRISIDHYSEQGKNQTYFNTGSYQKKASVLLLYTRYQGWNYFYNKEWKCTESK